MKRTHALATLTLVGLVGLPALGQSRSDRVDQLADTLNNAVDDTNTVYTQEQAAEPIRATPRQLMRQTIASVDIDALPGRLALEAWSNQTGIPLVINWASLETEGIDSQRLVTLQLRSIPADQVLKLLVSQLHPDPIGDDQLIIDVQQWYVRVITKRDALRKSVTRMYFIGDLLMDIPNFTQAPGFDLNEALNNTNSGGSNGGGGNNGNQGSLFGDEDNNENREQVLSKEEKAERIADVLRNGIEPDIWEANGGEYASISYYRGMLIVKAPEFVHEQIGVPVVAARTGGQSAARDLNDYRTDSSTTQRSSNQNRRRQSTPGNVSGTGGSGPNLVR